MNPKLILPFTLFCLIVILFLLKYTGTKKYEVYENKKSTQRVDKIIESSVEVKLPAETIVDHYSFAASSSKYITDSLYFAIYNHYSLTIDIFNLTSPKIITRIPLPNEIFLGDFFHDNRLILSSLELHSLDSLFVGSPYFLALLDSLGSLKFKKSLKDPRSKTSYNDYVFNNIVGFPIHYNARQNVLYFHGRCKICRPHTKQFTNSKFEMKYDLVTESFSLLNISYPKLYNNGYYGDLLNSMRVSVKDSFHIYTFPADPNIYKYNLFTNRYEIYGGESIFMEGVSILPLSKRVIYDKDSNLKLMTMTPEYGKLIYNSYENLYYRFFSQAQAEKNKKGLYNLNSDKPKSLIIFDDEFKIIKEFDFESPQLLIDFPVLSNEGIYILDLQKTLYDGSSMVWRTFTI